jgi:ligand-binding sensor domain-containing protein
VKILRRIQFRWSALALMGALVAAAGAGVVLHHTSRAVRDAAAQVALQRDVKFTIRRYDRAWLPPPGFESVSSPAVFSDVALFQDRVYLCGPSGLFAYDPGGTLTASYHVGLELPAAPLVQMATGVAAGSGTPELFMATAGEGLLAFDGQTFRQIRPAAADDRTLTTLLPLSTGRILMGTAKKGVLVYDGRAIATFHPALAGIHVTALAGDESSLWVGTLDRGVWHWHAGELDRFGESEGLPDPQVLALAISGDYAWAGTPMGIAEFRGGRFTRVLASGVFASSLLPRSDALLVGTEDEGMVEIPLNARSTGRGGRPSFQGDLLPGPVLRITDVGDTLEALSEDGLYALGSAGLKAGATQRAAGWRRLIARQGAGRSGLTDSNISALAFDDAGRLWVGYFDRGLDILDSDSRRATHIEDEHIFCVNRIVHDRDRGISAVATANGLALFDAAGRKQQVLGRADGLLADHVTDVVFRPNGMAVGTPAGVTLIDTAGTRSLYAFQGLVNNHVYTLADSGERLLVGTLGGLSVLAGDLVRASYTTVNSRLTHNWITAIVPVGNEWFVGTYGAGVLRFDSSGRWQSFGDAAALSVVNPNAMLVTQAYAYAGTLGHGLLVYNRTSGRWTQFQAGLPSANVTALAVRKGTIYVGTDNGLVRFPEVSLPF